MGTLKAEPRGNTLLFKATEGLLRNLDAVLVLWEGSRWQTLSRGMLNE